jgi:hypothetical protein
MQSISKRPRPDTMFISTYLVACATAGTRVIELQMFCAVAEVTAYLQSRGLVRQIDSGVFLSIRRQWVMAQPILMWQQCWKNGPHHVLKFDFVDLRGPDSQFERVRKFGGRGRVDCDSRYGHFWSEFHVPLPAPMGLSYASY